MSDKKIDSSKKSFFQEYLSSVIDLLQQIAAEQEASRSKGGQPHC